MGEKPGYKEIAEEFRDHAHKASRSLRHGEISQFYGSIPNQYNQSLVRPEMLDRALNLLRTTVFRPTSIFGYFAGTIKTEDGRLTNDTSIEGGSIEFSPLKSSRRDDFGLILHEVFMSRDFFKMTVRPYPIEFRLGHVFQRYAERSGNDPRDIGPEFRASMPFNLLLAEIIEQKMNRDKKNILPFAAPLTSGLLLGLAERVEPLSFGHEKHLVATTQGEIKFSRYKWLPEVKLSAYTYISRKDMFPEQRRLHDILKPYAKYTEDPSIMEMGRTYFDYMETGMRKEHTPPSEDFLEIKEKITRLVDSKLWKSAVRLPSSMTSGTFGYNPH